MPQPTSKTRFLVTFGRDTEGRIVEAFHGADWFVNARYTGAPSIKDGARCTC